MEESVRYGINEPAAYDEWLSTSTVEDEGHVRVGSNHRLGIIGVTHEQHCLRLLRFTLAKDAVPHGAVRNHCEHCLSFLRQQALCAADSTIEPGDAFARNFTAERVTVERECRMDPEAFYASMWHQWNEWVDFKQKTVST